MQHLGLLSFVLLVIGLGFTALVLPGGLGTTFSQRVANNKRAEVLYALLFIITLPLLYFFLALWFVPTNSLPGYFLIFAGIAVVFQIACTWWPERGGRMTVVHRILTGISGVALLPMVLIIASHAGLGTMLRYTAWAALALMTTLLVTVLVNQKGFKYALLLQIGYYALFFGVILMVAYLN